MDGIFCRNFLRFLLLALLNPNTSLPDLCNASEQSKQVSIKECGSLAIYCYSGPSATLSVTVKPAEDACLCVCKLACLMSVRMSGFCKSALICASCAGVLMLV